MLYTYGGNPSAVLATKTGDTVPDYPLIVRAAGTGAIITALFEEDGTTAIAQLRTNAANTDTPGAIRPFKVDGFGAIQYEYNGPSGQPVRWYEVGREVATSALEGLNSKLDTTGGTVTGDLNVTGTLDVTELLVGGEPLDTGADFSAAGMLMPTTQTGAAVQAALNAAQAAGGGWVVVRPGVYLITSTLRIYANTRLTLLPGAEFRRNVAATMLLNGDALQNLSGYTGNGNILVEGGLWNMRGTTSGLTASAMCISIGHASNVTIRGLEIRDLPGYHGIELNSTKNGLVENCRFRGYVDPGSRDFSEAVQIDLAKGSAEFGGFGPYDNTPCQDIEVRGCYFGASGTAGTTAWPRGVGSHSATVGTRHKRIRIVDNSFEGLLQYAVVDYAYDDTVIADNTISGCGAGIRIRSIISADAADSTNLAGVVTNASQTMSNVAITGNLITGGGSYDDAILLYGEATGRIVGAEITGNIIDTVGASENGIRVQYADQYTVAANTIRGIGGTGISQEQVTGGVVGPNRIYSVGASGISCDTGTGIQIAGNTVREAGVNGIHVLSGSDIQVQNNFVKGASRNASGSWGIRCSTAVDALLITGNKIRKFGSGNEVAAGIGITNTCTNVKRYGNDLADTGLDDASSGADTSPFDSAGVMDLLIRPSGRYETTSRLRVGTSNTPTSGTLYLVPIWLPKGTVVSNITFASAATAAVTPTNWWFSLHDSTKKALARTADQTTAAWAANAKKTLAIAQTTAGAGSSYTTTYTGLHYLGVMIKATTVPSLVSEGSIADFLASDSPGFGGTDAGLSTPPTVSGAGFTAGAFGTGSGILLYGYTT
ncbi:right-handed parallel beta-helix repeat-containing protein [Streptomyces sp. NPDC093509]|uniref:right-handed parallel beta-helix repeat-containing protein n=1 Tax=Streptomyces sp. NPDC093509 TaxID=3154982 RepID=UPI00344F632F